MYIICFNSFINGFEVAYIYYLNYAVGIKEVDSFKYHCGCQIRRLHADCAQFARSLPVKKIRHRLTRQVAKCPHLRANCANCKQTAPTTSHLGHRKVTHFCRCALPKCLPYFKVVSLFFYKTP